MPPKRAQPSRIACCIVTGFVKVNSRGNDNFLLYKTGSLLYKKYKKICKAGITLKSGKYQTMEPSILSNSQRT